MRLSAEPQNFRARHDRVQKTFLSPATRRTVRASNVSNDESTKNEIRKGTTGIPTLWTPPLRANEKKIV